MIQQASSHLNGFIQDHCIPPNGSIPMQGYYMYDGSRQQHLDTNSMRALQSTQLYQQGLQHLPSGLLLHNIPSYEPELPIGVDSFQDVPAFRPEMTIGEATRAVNSNGMPIGPATMQHEPHIGLSWEPPTWASPQLHHVDVNKPRVSLAQEDAIMRHQQFTSARQMEMTTPPGVLDSHNHHQMQKLMRMADRGCTPGDFLSTHAHSSYSNRQCHDSPTEHNFGRFLPVVAVYPAATPGQKGEEQQPDRKWKASADNNYPRGGKKGRGVKGAQQPSVDYDDLHDDTPPSPTKSVPADHQPGAALVECQCHLKMLMPNHIAGAIIGRDGLQIGEILLLTRCQMQISACNDFFPGTYDRILIMGGSMRALEDCIKMVLRHFKEVTDPNRKGAANRSFLCKLVVPCSAVSGLIGHCGGKVKHLSETTGCRINMSPRVKEMQERIVLIYGEFDSLLKATIFIAKEIQCDPHLKEHLALRYDEIDIPLGAWSGDKASPSDRSAPLIRPDDAPFYSKRELILYLQSAAPREILLRHCLLGRIENTMKSKGVSDLKTALRETWDFRTMELGEEAVTIRERPITPQQKPCTMQEIVMPLPPGEVNRIAMTHTQRNSFPISVGAGFRSESSERISPSQRSSIKAASSGGLPNCGSSSLRNESASRHRYSSRNSSQEKELSVAEEVVELRFFDITIRDDCESPGLESVDIARDRSQSVNYSSDAVLAPSPKLDRTGILGKWTRARSLSLGRVCNGSTRRERSAQARLTDCAGIEETTHLDQVCPFEAQVRARQDDTHVECNRREKDELRFQLADDEQLSELGPLQFQPNGADDVHRDQIVSADSPLGTLADEAVSDTSVEGELVLDIPMLSAAPQLESRGRHERQDIDLIIQMGSQSFESHSMRIVQPDVGPYMMSLDTILTLVRSARAGRPRLEPLREECDEPETEPLRLRWTSQEDRAQVLTRVVRVTASLAFLSSAADNEDAVDDNAKTQPWIHRLESMVRPFILTNRDRRKYDSRSNSGLVPGILEEENCHNKPWFAAVRDIVGELLVGDEQEEGFDSDCRMPGQESRFCSASGQVGRICSPGPCSWWWRKPPLRRTPGFAEESDSE